jgi:hypothetical protein
MSLRLPAGFVVDKRCPVLAFCQEILHAPAVRSGKTYSRTRGGLYAKEELFQTSIRVGPLKVERVELRRGSRIVISYLHCAACTLATKLSSAARWYLVALHGFRKLLPG